MTYRDALFASVAICATISATTAMAQASDRPPAAAPGQQASAAVQEVVVTAQKRSERLQDVPLSITAATGAQLQEEGITQVSDLQKIVPGFTYQPSETGTPIYTLRGVGFFSNTASVAPTVGLYVDQVPLPFSAESQGAGLDVERVEVLKGPQGTLFGENSTGGAINYIANKPTNHFEAGGQVGYGTFDDVNVQGFVSGPLADTLTARVAIATEQRGDWQKSESRPGDTLGQRDFTDGRGLLDWKPSDRLRFELSVNGWVDKSDTQAGQFLEFSPTLPSPPGYGDLFPALQAYQTAHTPAPRNARDADWVAGQSFRKNDNFYQTSLRADWDITNSITLTSLTAYSGLKLYEPTDLGGTNLQDLNLLLKDNIHTISQELRLAGTAYDGRLKWMVGGNYEVDYTAETQTAFDYDASNSGFGPFRYHDFVVQNDQDIETKAVFGSLDYRLLDTLTLQGSVRYTESDNTFHGCLRDAGDGAIATAFTFLANLANPATTNPGAGHCVTINPTTFDFVPIVAEKLDEDNTSWRVSLNWKPLPGTLLYANVTQGYKAGAFNSVPGVFVTQFDPVPQESLLAYEVGFKKDLFDRTLKLAGAGFYYDYTDKQLLGFVSVPIFGGLPGLITVPQSSITGAELSAAWMPIRGLTVNAGATYVDSDVTKHFVTTDAFNSNIDIKGEAFPDTAKWQLTADIQYEFPLTDTIKGYVGATPQYLSSSYSVFGEDALFKLNSRALLDLRAGFTNGKWRAEVWGRNVTDQFYDVAVNHIADSVSRLNGMPATFGFTLSYIYK